MRLASVSALVLTGFAVAACGGGGDFGDTTCGNLDIPATGPCLTAGASTGSGSGSGTTTVPIVPPPTGTGTSTNTGNTTTLATGDKTVALEFGNLISPATGSSSKLTKTGGTAKLAIDTKTSGNNTWPIPKTMDEYVAGTASSGGVGLGGAYKEYRALSYDTEGTLNDEELQVWNWGNSYATQYRDVTAGGGDARHQAWSFGGTATPTGSMPSGGSIIYTGRYGATSKTWNWVDDTNNLRTLSMNGAWQIEGTSNIQADFSTNTMTGTLTPSTWTGYQTLNGGTGRLTVSALPGPNFAPFMDDNVTLSGKISGNTVTGTAELDRTQGWVSGANPMYAGFYGAGGPAEVTGAYNFVAVSPDPTGGEPPINDDRRGFVQQSGVFHGQ